jgi:LPS-assembly protein
MVARATDEGGEFSPAKVLRALCFFISITGLLAYRGHLVAQQVTSGAPPPEAVSSTGIGDAPVATAAAELPDGPWPANYPDAVLVEEPDNRVPIHIGSSQPQSIVGSHYIADGDVVVTYKDRTLQADHLEYDEDTGEIILTGHVVATGGENGEIIRASHGSVNIRTETGRFYDVTGSVGLKPATGANGGSHRTVYANGNPFLFTGRMVVKSGPQEYYVYGGTVTSCALPKPDWLLSSAKFSVDLESGRASASNSVFHVVNIPLLWLPYVTHPVDTGDRQTGILIPEIGFNSASKGDTVGEQVYWAINRSTDLTVGTIYYSARGWEQTASFRYRGVGQDRAMARYSGLQDRGYYPGGVYVNQSGTDLVFSGRYDVPAEGPSGITAAPSPVQ